MRPRDAVAAVAVATFPAAGIAQTIDQSNGAAGAPILQLTTVPRAAALGGALTASAGVTSIFANPAGAATVEHLEAELAGQTLFDGSKAGSMAVGWRLHAIGLADGVRYLDLGSVDEVVCNACGGQGTATGQTLSAWDTRASVRPPTTTRRRSPRRRVAPPASPPASAAGSAPAWQSGRACR